MAKVLFFLQLIVALVALPLWPGLDPWYTFLGLGFLALIVLILLGVATAVHGVRAVVRALADAWSPLPLGPGAETSIRIWALAARVFPLAGILSALAVLSGGLQGLPSKPELPAGVLVLVFFCLVWGVLGLLLSRVLHKVVNGLAQRRISLLTLTPDFARRFGLTPREAEAAQAVLDGLTYRDAAEKLFVSPATVKSHVLSVYQKTGTGSKMELLRLVEAESARIHQKADGPSQASQPW